MQSLPRLLPATCGRLSPDTKHKTTMNTPTRAFFTSVSEANVFAYKKPMIDKYQAATDSAKYWAESASFWRQHGNRAAAENAERWYCDAMDRIWSYDRAQEAAV